MNVLLVIAENRALRETLRAAGSKTDLLIFESAVDDAGRRLVSLQADAIILDDGPGLGGEAIGAVKAIAPGTPVIALSNRGDVITQAGLMRAGADSILVKPFSCDALREAIDQHVAKQPAGMAQRPAKGSGYAGYGALNQHQMALRWLSRAASYSNAPLRLSQSLVESAGDIFGAVRTAVLLEQEDGVRVAASEGISDTIAAPLCLNYGAGLMRWFDEHTCVMDWDAVRDAPDARKELQVLGGRLAAPLLQNGRVFGAIVLGEKAAGMAYAPEERELLTLIARTTSVAFERAGAIRETSQRQTGLERVLAHMRAAIVTVSPDRTIAMINQEAERILEVRAVNICGRSVQKLGSAFADIVLRTLADGQPRLAQEIHDPAIKARLFVHAAPMGDDGVVATFSTAPRAQTASEDIAYSPFWKYLSERVAQEIKNPMVAINTFAQLLPRKYDSEDFRDAFSRVVQKEIARINAVAETLFEFAEDPRLTLKHCSVRETLEGVLKSFETELAARSIALETHWDPEVDEADMDPVFFSQAVHNVVQNSIDAMPEGGKLLVSTKKDGDETDIQIADTGPGMPKEDEDLVFLPFYSTKERGMGLGLPAASRIMQRHQGDLNLVANDAGGSRFSMRLPITEKGDADNSGD